MLTTFGSLGDLHPYVAIALGLKERGHDAVLVTSKCYRQKVEALGLGFRPLRPDSDFVSNPKTMRWVMHPRWGTVWVVRDILFPVLRQSYEDTLEAATEADLLVSHPLAGYATRLVAEKTGTPWASTMITPLGFFSAHDLPVMPAPASVLNRLRFLGPPFLGPLLWLGKRATRFLARPWYRLRAEIGLPPTRARPIHWPTAIRLCCTWPCSRACLPPSSRTGRRRPSSPASRFTTAGRAAAWVGGLPGRRPAARRVHARSVGGDGRRPVLRTQRCRCEAAGRAGRPRRRRNARSRPASLPDGVAACDYAPFSELFPRAAVIVHPGGIGTTGLVMRAGRPMLVVPHAHDQPDNAERAARLGIARTVPPRRYTPSRVAAELRILLDDPSYARRASEVGQQLRREDGVQDACDALEQLLQTTRPAVGVGR